jgi:hypothetical protein
VADNAELVAAQAVPLMIEDLPDQKVDVDMDEGMRDRSSSSSPSEDVRGSPVNSGEEEHPAVRRPWTKRTFTTGRRRKRRRSSSASLSRASSASVPPLAESSGSDKEPCEEELAAHAKWKSKHRAAPDPLSEEILREAPTQLAPTADLTMMRAAR